MSNCYPCPGAATASRWPAPGVMAAAGGLNQWRPVPLRGAGGARHSRIGHGGKYAVASRPGSTGHRLCVLVGGGERVAARGQRPGCDLEHAGAVHALVLLWFPALQGLAVDEAVGERQCPEVRHAEETPGAAGPRVVADPGGVGTRARPG